MVGTVLFASDNAKSLMLTFGGILAGHVGSMPALLDDQACIDPWSIRSRSSRPDGEGA